MKPTPALVTSALKQLKLADPVLCEIINRVGEYRLEYREPSFETLVKSIVYQQLSGRVASVIFARLAAAAGGKLTPANILKLRPTRMRAAGLSTQKTSYIRDLARHTRDGRVVFEELDQLPDEAVIETLTMVLPTGDLGIRSAIRRAYGFPELPKPAEIETLALQWRPYCSVASWYLWRSLEAGAEVTI